MQQILEVLPSLQCEIQVPEKKKSNHNITDIEERSQQYQ